jgi:hypothetical protein
MLKLNRCRHYEWEIRTIITSPKLFGHHGSHNVVNVFGMRVPSTNVNCFLIYDWICSMTGLQYIESPSHVTARELEKSLPSVTSEIDTRGGSVIASDHALDGAPFCIYHGLYPLLYL